VITRYHRARSSSIAPATHIIVTAAIACRRDLDVFTSEHGQAADLFVALPKLVSKLE
jgi:hypothetical protein